MSVRRLGIIVVPLGAFLDAWRVPDALRGTGHRVVDVAVDRARCPAELRVVVEGPCMPDVAEGMAIPVVDQADFA